MAASMTISAARTRSMSGPGCAVRVGQQLTDYVEPGAGSANAAPGDPTFMMHVYSAALLTSMLLAGVGIARLGALVSARLAARPTISEVLHNK